MTNRRKTLGFLASLALFVAIAVGPARADLVVDVTVSSNVTSTSTLGRLDLTTGQFTATATLSVTVVSLTSGSDGTVYAGANDGSLYTIGGNGSVTPFGSITAPVPPGQLQNGYDGLAYAGSSGFYGANLNQFLDGTATSGFLDQISPSGNSVSTLGSLGISQLDGFSTGDLAFGPNGTLYFTNYGSSDPVALYSVNTTTGAATIVGSGLGTVGNDALTLVNVGGQLFGIDTVQPSGSGPINIYTINTTTGVATLTGVTVSGLADGFTLDTAAAVVPEPNSFTLCALAGAAGVAIARVRRRRDAA